MAKPQVRAGSILVAYMMSAVASYGLLTAYSRARFDLLACTQGKVRRIRTSPFHKGSGDSAPAAAKPAAAAKKAKKKADTFGGGGESAYGGNYDRIQAMMRGRSHTFDFHNSSAC